MSWHAANRLLKSLFLSQTNHASINGSHVNLAASRGFRISNIDCTLICEFPKIGPHADAMQQALARITKTDADRISVKATTSEKLGFTGRGEGIACLATVTVIAS